MKIEIKIIEDIENEVEQQKFFEKISKVFGNKVTQEESKGEPRIKYPKEVYGRVSNRILAVLKDKEILNAREIAEYIGTSYETVQANLSQIKEKIGKSTSGSPKKYFLKGENPELREMLKNVKHR